MSSEQGRVDIIREAYEAMKNDGRPGRPSFLEQSVGFLLEECGKLSMNQYQERARQTAIYPKRVAIDYCAGKLASEAGEVIGKVMKRYRDDDGQLKQERKDAIANEIGHVLWYCAMLAYELGYNLEKIAQDNLDELADRKRRGKLHGDGDLR